MTQIIEMIDAAMVEMASITPPLRRSECEQLIRAALAAVKVVSEDKREVVTITSVKMVGGVAPEADLMRQAIAQLEGMGFRVEHPKAVQPQAQGEAARLWCETCEGGGTVDNTLGGDNINSTSHDKCPDCDGHGYFLSSVYRTRGQQP